MALRAVGSGVFVSTDSLTLATPPDPFGFRRRDAREDEGGDEGLRDALRQADFEIAVELVPALDIAPRRRGDEPPAEVAVAVAPDEGAVLLLEAADGTLQWQIHGARAEGEVSGRRGGGGGDARVELIHFVVGQPALPELGGRRGSAVGWIADKLFEPVRTYVLRFLAQRTIDALVARIEGDMPVGPVHITTTDPADWTPAPLGLVLDRHWPSRILLMVHGTFSSTAGSFGALARTGKGQAFLAAALRDYDLILGFDHKTLAEDTLTNAQAILAKLVALRPASGSTIDAVGFSRGGLVLRTLIETLLPETKLDVRVGKAVFVGATNSGTNLAEPENWADLIDLYTNVAVIGARLVQVVAGGGTLDPLVTGTIRTLGRFVQMLSQVAISERYLPGLAAMEPNGPVVTALNRAEILAGSAAYHAISASFEPAGGLPPGFPGRFAAFLADRISDRLFQAPNDLVVNTGSMRDFGGHQRLLAQNAEFRFGDTAKIYHTIYFTSEDVAGKLEAWLCPQPAERFAGAALPPRAPAPDVPFPGSRWFVDESPAGDRGMGRRSLPAAPSLPAEEIWELRFVEPAPAETVELDVPAPAEILCNISAEMAPAPTLDRAARIYVMISGEELEVADHDAAAVAQASVDARQPIKIEAIPRRNCTIVGDPFRTIAFTGGEPQLTSFTIEGIRPGLAEILIVARQGIRQIASLPLAPMFVAPGRDRLAVAQPVDTSGSDGRFAVLRIYESFQPNGSLSLRFDLASETPAFGLLETVMLRPGFSIDAYVATVFAEIEAAWKLTGENGLYDAFLERFEADAIVRTNALIPEKIRAALWKHRADIKAIQVISEEPLIPWELMYICDPVNAPGERYGFLSEWGLVRWLHGTKPPGRRLGLSGARSRYVIPDYLDRNKLLKGAAEEQQMLERLFDGVSAVEPSSKAVQAFLETGATDCGLLHFACHGEAEQKAILNSDLLMRGIRTPDNRLFKEYLSAEQVKTKARFSDDPSGSLVFLNACQTGRQGEGIAGVAGFADSFLRPTTGRGAAAFVGALWSIDDKVAKTFAETFYTRLLAGDMLVEAMSAARNACKQTEGDFTWLAYTVFGNPLAKAVP